MLWLTGNLVIVFIVLFIEYTYLNKLKVCLSLESNFHIPPIEREVYLKFLYAIVWNQIS